MKKVLMLFVVLVISGTIVSAQSYQQGRFWVGPTVGYSIFGSLGLGATAEYGITPNIGIGADIAYSSFTEDFGSIGGSYFSPGYDASWEYTQLGIFVSGSYHFMPTNKFDPFVKIGLGYMNWGAKFVDEDGKEIDFMQGVDAGYASGVGISGQIGARYHFNDMVSARATLGYPFIVSAGVDFAFGDPVVRSTSATKIAPKSNTTYDSDGNQVVKATRTTTVATSGTVGPRYALYAGPYLGAKIAVNTSIADGRSVSPNFTVPSVGASLLVPFSTSGKIGFLVDLGYDPIAYTTKPSDDDVADDKNTITERYNYMNITPSLYLKGFIIGINFGIPMSADIKDADGDKAYVLDKRGFTASNYPAKGDKADPVDFLSTMMELRVGGSIPLVENNVGKLSLNIMGGYVFSGLYEDEEVYKYSYEKTDSGIKSKNELNPKPASLTLGLSYMFRIGF